MTALTQAGIGTEARDEGADDIVEFFSRHKKRAFHFALQMVGNTDDAMDLTQEAFLRLHREWPRRDRSRDPAPWLFTVLRNLALDMLRRRAVHNECELEGLSPESPVPGPELLALRSETATRLWKAICALPLAQREVLVLRDWHGLSYAEIAEVVGTNVGPVTSRLHHARTALRERMGRYL